VEDYALDIIAEIESDNICEKVSEYLSSLSASLHRASNSSNISETTTILGHAISYTNMTMQLIEDEKLQNPSLDTAPLEALRKVLQSYYALSTAYIHRNTPGFSR
jgi:hypothetical protein